MIDIHTHILPGFDDGAEDIYDTLEMIRMSAESGVSAVVATPHCNLPGMFDNYFGEKYMEVYQKVVNAVQKEKLPVKIMLGMEAFATWELPDLIVEKKIMPLNQSRYVLLEFAFDEDPDYADDLLRRVKHVGARPVIAHAERYEFIQDNPQIAYRWRQRGYVIQANKGSFQGRFGRAAMESAHRMLKHNLVSVVASDAHSPFRRTTYMRDAYAELEMEYPRKYLQLVFHENPRRICANMPILKAKPIPFSRRN